MPQPTPKTSEEDHSTPAYICIQTAEQAFQVAAAYANAPADEEWLVSLCLDPTLTLIDMHYVFGSQTCRPCPEKALEAWLDAAVECHPHRLIMVKYHRDPWCGPRTKGMRRFRTFCRKVGARGLSLHEAYVADSTGEVYPLIGEPVSAPIVQLATTAAVIFGYIVGISEVMGIL